MGAGLTSSVGVVVHRIPGGSGAGEVSLKHGGETHIYLAFADEEISPGTQVVVTVDRGSRHIDVVPLYGGSAADSSK